MPCSISSTDECLLNGLFELSQTSLHTQITPRSLNEPREKVWKWLHKQPSRVLSASSSSSEYASSTSSSSFDIDDDDDIIVLDLTPSTVFTSPFIEKEELGGEWESDDDNVENISQASSPMGLDFGDIKSPTQYVTDLALSQQTHDDAVRTVTQHPNPEDASLKFDRLPVQNRNTGAFNASSRHDPILLPPIDVLNFIPPQTFIRTKRFITKTINPFGPIARPAPNRRNDEQSNPFGPIARPQPLSSSSNQQPPYYNNATPATPKMCTIKLPSSPPNVPGNGCNWQPTFPALAPSITSDQQSPMLGLLLLQPHSPRPIRAWEKINSRKFEAMVA